MYVISLNAEFNFYLRLNIIDISIEYNLVFGWMFSNKNGVFLIIFDRALISKIHFINSCLKYLWEWFFSTAEIF